MISFSMLVQHSNSDRMAKQKLLLVQNQCNILGNQILVNQFTMDNLKGNLSVQIDQLANVWEGRILVVDSSYRILKDTYTIDQNDYIIYDEAVKVMRGEKDRNIRMVDDYAEIIIPIVDAEKVVSGIMIATVSMADIKNNNEFIHNQINILIMLFAMLAICCAYVLSRVAVSGSEKLNKQIQSLSEGHLETLKKESRYNEYAELTDSFNVLLDKMQMLEDSRQEFVSNVSHELKTPITSMKVLADSLLMQEEVPNEMYREFMGDMVDEIDRESKIINDLLTLVKMDKKSSALNIAPVNINSLLELLLKRIKPIAAKRNIEVTFESFRDVVGEIDEVKLTLAFSNLIENAVKYNNDGGSVYVSLNSDHKFFYVKVQDTGVGIPEDAQSQVFERFYRVDKARSRDTGGTGLGLAITRNAILMHKGAIKLYSEPGEGTTFTVRIPLKYVN
jgi:signal transduction histidine kinase